ncbi:MAG: hypothetical protein KJ955_05830 [Nanoarchaeota archaeon]|nr:hypothetical protein [Nanoarchaeota archaeon]
MATTLTKILAASIIAGSVSAGCIEEDCADTYFLNEPQVMVENDLDRRVVSIDLGLATDQRPFVPAQYRGIPVSSNLSIYCAPVDRNGNLASSGCVDGKKFEFYAYSTDEDGNVHPIASDHMAGFAAKMLKEINENYANSWGAAETLTCVVRTPRCSTAGYPYIDEYGRERFQETAWRPETLVGTAEAEIVIEQLCPAPIPPFKPVDESEWRPSSEDEL